MHAIIETGGKQYRVAPGDTLRVEKLDGDVGSEIELAVKAAFNDAGELGVQFILVEGPVDLLKVGQ